jgi:hypothetical protein
MDLGGEVLVNELGAVADDVTAIGSVAERCLLSNFFLEREQY